MEKLEILNLELKEVRNELCVIVETPYGVENIGMKLKKKYLDINTDKPKWMSETKELLEYKYNKEVLLEDIETAFNKEEELVEL